MRALSNDRRALNAALQNLLPKVMFVVLPLVALVQFWVYRRQRPLYLENLVFVLHFQSFYYLPSTFALLLAAGITALAGAEASDRRALRLRDLCVERRLPVHGYAPRVSRKHPQDRARTGGAGGVVHSLLCARLFQSRACTRSCAHEHDHWERGTAFTKMPRTRSLIGRLRDLRAPDRLL